uniref:Carboxypeptidase n=1 Tax=Acrobeloides nanus TaxID=290746 RepID=A0A914D582_9BILA
MLFQPNFKTYSGYLNANSNGTWKLHYMLTESRNNPEQAPLLFWFNGGPGCSSFSGSFEELGPFYIYKDGKSIYENVYSWNYQANVLYLESPVGTGYSYSTDDPHYHKADDDQSLEQNLHALKDFFSRVMPKYQNRPFFLSGESYAGVYLPMLGAAITNGTLDGSFPNKNFAGIAIGNGFMDVPGLTNSLILWSNYHGRISLDNWERLKKPDCCNTTSDIDSCDWTQNLESQNRIDFVGKNTPCGNILNDIINATGLYPALDPYNYYEDCYIGSQITWFAKPRRHYRGIRDETNDPNYFQNPANLINRDSTDNMWGYPCWQENYVFTYFNDPSVQTAFHIDQAWMNAKINFSDCNADLYNQYINKYNTMDQFFDTILKNIENPTYPVKNFRILIYNGDVDTVCNFLGDSKFIKKVSDRNGFTSNNRTRWWYRTNIAGFYQTYSSKSSRTTIDVLTVKGAGHMVPMDRAGPSQQMITNFMLYNGSIVDYSYNKNINENPTPIPLLNNNSSTQPTGAGISQKPLAVTIITALCFILFTKVNCW